MIVETEGLTRTFVVGRRKRVTAVEDVTLTVAAGEAVGFLGPNGAGKSTTMRAVVGLDRPDAGDVLVGGRRYADNAAPLYDLVAGEYTLVVSGVGQSSGNYAFRLLDIAQGTPITAGDTVHVQLDPANATAIYNFVADAGDRYYFDNGPASGGELYWRLMDPNGAVVFGPLVSLCSGVRLHG